MTYHTFISPTSLLSPASAEIALTSSKFKVVWQSLDLALCRKDFVHLFVIISTNVDVVYENALPTTPVLASCAKDHLFMVSPLFYEIGNLTHLDDTTAVLGKCYDRTWVAILKYILMLIGFSTSVCGNLLIAKIRCREA